MAHYDKNKDMERKKDEKAEKLMRQFTSVMYEHEGLSARFMTKEDFPELSEAEITTQEKNGIDVVMTDKRGHVMNVDEKVATAQNNAYRNLQTYSMEIMTQNNGHANGWLFNENSQTTHYAFVYTDCQGKEDVTNTRAMEIILMPKDTIKNYIKDMHIAKEFTPAALEAEFNKHAEWNNDYTKESWVMPNGIKMVRSHGRGLEESQPLNILIPRSWLREHATIVMDTHDVQMLRRQMEYEKEQQRLAQEKLDNMKHKTGGKEGVVLDARSIGLLNKEQKQLGSPMPVKQMMVLKESDETLPQFTDEQLQKKYRMSVVAVAKGDGFNAFRVTLDGSLNKLKAQNKTAVIICSRDKEPTEEEIRGLSFKKMKRPLEIGGTLGYQFNVQFGNICQSNEEYNQIINMYDSQEPGFAGVNQKDEELVDENSEAYNAAHPVVPGNGDEPGGGPNDVPNLNNDEHNDDEHNGNSHNGDEPGDW